MNVPDVTLRACRADTTTKDPIVSVSAVSVLQSVCFIFTVRKV